MKIINNVLMKNSWSNSKVEYGCSYNPADQQIYYASNLSSKSNLSYEIWRMNLDGKNQEKILAFDNSGWCARGLYMIKDNKLSFYEANVFHEMMELDLSQTFPITRSVSDGESPGVKRLLLVLAD